MLASVKFGFFFQADDGIRDLIVTGVQTCALPISAGPSVVALYDLVSGDQRWANEALFEQAEPQKRGFGALMQGLQRTASEGTALEVLQAGPDMIVVHTLMGLRAL